MNQEVDVLVPRSQVAREFGVVPRTIIRWEIDRLPGFDEPITINKRIYHRRSSIERAKGGGSKSAA
jgi:hypothetical protein